MSFQKRGMAIGASASQVSAEANMPPPTLGQQQQQRQRKAKAEGNVNHLLLSSLPTAYEMTVRLT